MQTESDPTARISTAIDVLEAERERVAAERAAFARFRSVVAEIEPSAPDSGTAAGGPARTVVEPTADRGLERIREAYRATVMDVPHYEESYGEPLVENVAAELDPDAARTIADGRYTPPLRAALVAHSRTAADSRARLLDALDEERDTLETSADRLRAIAAERPERAIDRSGTRSLDGLLGDRETVCALCDRCDEVAIDRQAALRRSPGDGRSLDADEITYVYESLSVDHPVLADVATLGERLDQTRQRIDGLLAARLGGTDDEAGRPSVTE